MKESLYYYLGQNFALKDWSIVSVDQVVGKHRLIIRTNNPIKTLVAVWDAWDHQLVPVLDPQSSLTILTSDFVVDDECSLFSLVEKKQTRGQIEFYLHNYVVFCTSGSTGNPQEFKKEVKDLVREVEVLSKVYKFPKKQLIIHSLILPQHIYGFLNTVVLPSMYSSHIYFFEALDLITMDQTCDLLFLVPSIYDGIEPMLDRNQVKCIISSGAPFGRLRRERLMNNILQGTRAYEILGSTETGGIGFSKLNHKDAIFQLLDTVTLKFNERWYIQSSFLGTDEELVLDDNFQMIDERYFKYLGRIDQIFKYSGKRYSLTEITKIIQIQYPSSQLKCHFFHNEDSIKGGELFIWMTDVKECPNDLRKKIVQLVKINSLKVIKLENFPINKFGKITIQDLLKTQ